MRIIQKKKRLVKCNLKSTNRGLLNRSAMGTNHQPEFAKAVVYNNMEELQRTIGNAAGVIKLYMTICNNATFLILGNAYDEIRKHPIFVQKFHPARGWFQKAMKEWKNYEANLLYNRTNRFFCLDDMPEDVRKKYANITNKEYYEYWCATGAYAYTISLNEINSLRYKYEKSLVSHGVPNARLLSWGLLVEACLDLCEDMYQEQLKIGAESTSVSASGLDTLFNVFRLTRVSECWKKALMLTTPKDFDYELTEDEIRNIELGVIQLAKKWCHEDTIYGASFQATDDFQEIFRTKGEWKKALRLIQDVRAEINNL